MTIYDDKTLARFWQKVEKRGPDECWEWTASRHQEGYGRFQLNKPRKCVRTHIFSYVLHNGPTNGLCVCHSCDNPPCVNPDHLWLGTPKANAYDMIRKGRAIRGVTKGEQNGRAVITDEDVRNIRKLINAGVYNTEIAPIYGVTHSMISRIKHGKAWTHLK